MILRSPEYTLKPAFWLKALLLSPGMLFLFGYLGIYFAASMCMNGAFKQELQQRYPLSGENTHTITIGSIRPDFSMKAITLSRIVLTPTKNCPATERRHVRLKKIDMAVPELEKTLFSSRRLRESASLVCSRIREEERKVQ
ncbi:MAG: hypothetical protein FJZ79_04925 [Chlorobi bacterium]|nr:hypothetical protein [Chlorobiota bacterium]